MKITVNAFAKINLFLDIGALLDNGYHSLFMIMQSVGLHDTVVIETNESRRIIVTCSDKSLPSGKKNIAYKAAAAFFEKTGAANSGLAVRIGKAIPAAAGLAGGSADAAAVIAGLDRLYGTNLGEKALVETGLAVGSDVPFCLTGGTMLVQDTGGVLSKLPDLPPCCFVIAKPDESVSTKEAYAAYDAFGVAHRPDKCRMLNRAAAGDLKGMCDFAGNVFEQIIEVTDRVEIKAVMRKHGALCSQMSGSGPSVFGIFEDKRAAEQCASELGKLVKQTFVCGPVNRGLFFENE